MSSTQATGNVQVEQAEAVPRGGSCRFAWSIKLAVAAALVCGAWLYVAQEAYRQAGEAAFVRGQEAIASALVVDLPDSVAGAVGRGPDKVDGWLKRMWRLPGVDALFLSDPNGKVVASTPDKSLPEAVKATIARSAAAAGHGVWTDGELGERWLVVAIPLAKGAPYLHLVRADATLAIQVNRFRLEQAAWAVAIPLILAMVVFLLTGPVTRRILAVSARLQKVGQGLLDAKVPRVGSGEVGRLEAAFNSAVWSLKGRMEKGADEGSRRQHEMRDLEKALARLRGGDLKVQMEGSGVALKHAREIFNVTVQELREFLSSLRQAAEATNNRGRSLTAGGRDATLKSNECRIHADHLTNQIEEILKHINSANQAIAGEQEALAFLASVSETGEGSVMQVVTDLYEKADEGARQVANKVSGLSQQGMEIGKLTELIAEVSGQTNLLALNAALEASRAGEQGRGFAAVADEIRKLAVKVTETAAEIQRMVETVTEDTSAALALIDTTGSELSGNKVMVEAALASFNDLVDSAKSARVHAVVVEERLAEIDQAARDLHVTTRQIGDRAASSTATLEPMSNDLAAITRTVEASIKRLNRLQLDPPEGVTSASPAAAEKGEKTAAIAPARRDVPTTVG